ncbi:aminotransferase class V-fold PLP-dependent enzyme, partial [Vibrio hepatarius]|uniref:aminotransferase class V-fold PLP-dependent enzyme n=1 Tax=Vibrio hepatarius TaxID=171383 RepID=UPI00142DE8BF
MLDVNAVTRQFPALQQTVNDQRLVYLDSAATTQKPQCVIDAISRYYSQQNANVHRGSHSLTAHATSQFESARETVADFIHADSSKEIIWTRGATEALNLVAQ